MMFLDITVVFQHEDCRHVRYKKAENQTPTCLSNWQCADKKTKLIGELKNMATF